MPDPLPPSILCPILIGRDLDVAALARLLEQASAGHGHLGDAWLAEADVHDDALSTGAVAQQQPFPFPLGATIAYTDERQAGSFYTGVK